MKTLMALILVIFSVGFARADEGIDDQDEAVASQSRDQIPVAENPHPLYEEDADVIQMKAAAQESGEAIPAQEPVEDIATKGPRLLALSGKEAQMPKVMIDTVLKRRAFHLCRKFGFVSVEEKPETKLLQPVPAQKDYKVVHWMEGNLEPLSAAKVSHWTTTNDNGRGRHEVSGPFAVFSELKCAR